MQEPSDKNDPFEHSSDFEEDFFGKGKKEERSKTPRPQDKKKKGFKNHENSFVRFFAKTGYTVWIIVMAVGLLLAFGVSLFLL